MVTGAGGSLGASSADATNIWNSTSPIAVAPAMRPTRSVHFMLSPCRQRPCQQTRLPLMIAMNSRAERLLEAELGADRAGMRRKVPAEAAVIARIEPRQLRDLDGKCRAGVDAGRAF